MISQDRALRGSVLWRQWDHIFRGGRVRERRPEHHWASAVGAAVRELGCGGGGGAASIIKGRSWFFPAERGAGGGPARKVLCRSCGPSTMWMDARRGAAPG